MSRMVECRISKLVKDDKRICSARVIFATLEDSDGNKYWISWVSGPAVVRTNGEIDYQETADFTKAWNEAKVGMNVDLYQLEEESKGYFALKCEG